ncbi:MAG TPA: tetratricopeptide repeat protein [Polyangiaceae bacterium]|nr:tetratricopeptide repeat protein [Polyangiaceae bacterium]
MAIDRERILVAAQKYVEKKRYDRAAIEYQKILQEDPSDARILLKLGDLQSKMEAYADAVATYDRVGKFYASQGFALKAIAVFKQIREIIARHVPALDEKYSHITPKLAELYQQLGLTSDALAALDEVATRLQRQNRDGEAIDVFRRIVELDPTNPLPHLRLAEAYSRVKDIDAAILEFGTASGQLLKLGRRDDALKVIDRILVHKPDPAHARIAAELYLQRGSVPDGMQALAKLQLCFQANPRDLDTLALLARAFTQIGQAGKAIEVQKEMARIARDTNRPDMFRELVARLVKLAPNDEGVRELAAAANGQAGPTAANPTAQAGATNALAAQTGQGAGPSKAAVPAAPASQKALPAREESEEEEAYEDVGDSDFETDEASSNDLALHGAHGQPAGAGRPDARAAAAAAPRADELVNVSKTLGEAAAYRRARRHDDALRVLRNGVRAAPRSVELHEMYRDVLLDAGHTAEAVAQMIQVAELLVEALDGDGAARSLQDALALEPDNAIAARMLHDLGYELVEEGAPLSVTADDPDAAFDTRARQSSYNPDAPLPSYDLEEIGPEHVAVRSYGEGSERALAAAQPVAVDPGMDAIDDPFADAPLPSFPLDAHEAATSNAGHVVPERASHRRPSSGTPRGIPELESALEEADFFASRGLFDDARTILEEQLARLPNHPLIRDRLAELEMQERSVGVGSGTRPSPAAASSEDVAGRDAHDVIGSLGLGAPATAARGPLPGEQVDVEEVFAKFKAGVAAQIGEGDAQSHYDLGVAYKEMALLDDAMREFDVAARDPKHECICHSMIGMIQIERGNLNEAINAYQRGLSAKDRTKDQEAALCYELGAAYEAKKLVKQALEYFTRAARLAPSFRDVQERIRRLQKPEQKPQPARAVGADDEFDRAFNDILGEDKRS